MSTTSKQTLVQRIALDGGEDIKAQLSALGDVGKAAFEKLQEAAAKTQTAASPFNKFLTDATKQMRTFSQAAEKVGTAWAGVGTAVQGTAIKFTLLTAAITGASGGLVELVKGAAEAVDATGKAAQAAGLTVEDYTKLSFAFNQGGVESKAFATALRTLNVGLNSTTKAAKDTSDATDVASAEGIARANANARTMAGDLLAVTDSITTGQAAFSKDVVTTGDVTAASIKKTNTDLLQSTQGSTAALTKLHNDQAAAQDESAVAAAKAAQAADKAVAAQAANANKAAQALAQLGIATKGADGQLRPTAAIIGDIAEAFKNMPDGATKSALAVELFGKAGATMIPVLDKGRAALVLFGEEAEKAGVVLTDAQVQVGDNFIEALKLLQKTLGSIKIAFGLAFAPALTTLFTGLTNLVNKNRAAMDALFSTIANQVTPVVSDLFAILSGNAGNDETTKNLESILGTVQDLFAAFKTLEAVVSFAFDSIVNAIQPLLDGINDVFGTHFTAQQVIFVALLGEVLGAFKILGAGIKAVDVTWEVLSTKFGTGLATVILRSAGLILALGVVKTTVIDLTDAVGGFFSGAAASGQNAAASIAKDFSALLNSLVTAFVSVYNSIASVFQSVYTVIHDAFTAGSNFVIGALITLTKAFGVFEDFLVSVWDNVLTHFLSVFGRIKAFLAAIAALGGTGGGDTTTASAPQAHAEGGPIRGPGTGTSDSILARISNGEFILRAKAVRQYGIGFLSALNAGQFRGFASGGYASVTPRAAAIGAASLGSGGGSSGVPFSLHLGDSVFDNLMAPPAVAGKMVTYARTRAVRSAGRKPNWHNG